MEKSGKGLLNRQQQDKVSEQRGMPVEVVADSSFLVDVAGEAVALYYYDVVGTLTADAGEIAGTVVVGKFTNGGILRSLGDAIGTNKDTSLSFTCDALTEEVAFKFLNSEIYDQESGKQRANKIVEGLTNGKYCIDYRYGVIYGKKATATTGITGAAYKVASQTSSGGTVVTGDTNIAKVGGTAITLGQKAKSSSVPVVIASDQDINVDSNSVNTNGYIGKASGTNADFVTAYASATTLTCATLPSGVSSIEADDIVSIVQIATGGSVTNTYTRDDVTVTSAGTDPSTITVTGAAFVASDTFVVYTNVKSVDTPETLTSGNKTVTTSGTAEVLGTTLAAKSIYIRAKSGNTNDIFVGDSTVDATTNKGIILAANDSITISIADRATVYVDVTTNGEGVDYIVMS